MQLIERTKKEQKSYDKQKRKEVFMKNLTLLKARILKTKLDPSDTRTIQVHSDTEGKMRNFYISNPYLQTNANFTCVSSILEDYENNRFIYKGMLLGADNAIGVVEFNVPISEVVADPNGNVKFQEMISEENALGVCQRYWDKIGENAEKIKGHSTYFGKPDFVLGTLLKRENGTFEYTDTIDDTVEKMLAQDRESARQKEMLRNKESVEIDLGGDMVVARQDCWLQQGNGIKFDGINMEALFYEYDPQKPIKTNDDKYVYIGNLQIGESKAVNQGKNEPIQFVSPFSYDDVVLWTDGKNLIQYFLDNKFAGLNLTLGEIFTTSNVQEKHTNDPMKIIGGVTLDEEGKCKQADVIPESVKKAVEEFFSNKEKQSEKIINFSDFSRG